MGLHKTPLCARHKAREVKCWCCAHDACMNTSDAPKRIPAAATAPPLPADDPRLTPEAIEYRRANGIAERDKHGRLLPGSQLPNKGRKPGPQVTALARQHTEEAVALLAEVMRDPKASQGARVTDGVSAADATPAEVAELEVLRESLRRSLTEIRSRSGSVDTKNITVTIFGSRDQVESLTAALASVTKGSA